MHGESIIEEVSQNLEESKVNPSPVDGSMAYRLSKKAM